MRVIRLFFINLMLFIALPACGEKGPDNGTVRIETEDHAVAEALKQELDSRNIWYSVLGETSVEVRQDSAALALNVLNEIGKPLLPAERHASFPDGKYEKVTAELERNNIPFKVVEAFNDKWIVWEDGDTDKVMEIIDSVTIPSD